MFDAPTPVAFALRRLFLGLLVAIATLLFAPRDAEAGCGMGNECAVVDSVTFSGTDPVTVTCTAHDPDGLVTKVAFSASAGTFSNGATTLEVIPEPQAPSTSAVALWNPVADAVVSCVAWDSGGFLGLPTQGVAVSTTWTPPVEPPVITSLVAQPPSVLVGGSTTLTATATDPTGGALRCGWASDAGSVSPLSEPGLLGAVWTAPDSPGTYLVQLTVRNDAGGEATAALPVSVGWAGVGSAIASDATILVPGRMAIDAGGNLYVADVRAAKVRAFTAKGKHLRTIEIDGRPGGLAVNGSGEVYVGDLEHGRIVAYDELGVPRRVLGQGDAELATPLGIAVDPFEKRVYVAGADEPSVRVYDEATGVLVSILAVPEAYPLSVAIDPVAGELYVGDSRRGEVRVLSKQGLALRTLGSFGSGPGQMTRVGGLGIGADGNVYVADLFQSRIAAFDRQGTFIAFIGTYGEGLGELEVPVDVAGSPFGHLFVANTENNRVERFELNGAVAPACPDDADCDGMSDAWEVARGFDPNDPTDAYLDADGDGLANVAEYRAGTDPWLQDSDGDGMGDGAEVVAGQDPTEPSDNRPVANAGADEILEPTHVVLDGTGSFDPNGDSLSFAWQQVGGPVGVELDGTDPSRPSVVLRESGVYAFQVRVSDGRVWSEWDTVSVTIANVEPTADAGRNTSGQPGLAVALDGRFSSDANGEPLTYQWIQVAGPRVELAGEGAERKFVPTVTGTYGFDLVVADGEQASPADRVYVTVGEGDVLPTAIVPALVEGVAGSTVVVDASASVVAGEVPGKPGGAPGIYTWEQLEGPPVVPLAGNPDVLAFVPTGRAVYRFSLVVDDGVHVSVPATTTVVVDASQDAVPRAEAGPAQHVSTLAEVILDCDASTDADGDAIACSWQQIEGTHVPLGVVDGQASFVPIEAGTYEFELAVSDADGPGTRDTVLVVVDEAGGNHVPLAVASATMSNTTVTLHGEASADADAKDLLFHTWTQVSGPAIALADPHAVTPTFAPVAAGSYAFELCVDDGKTRSPSVKTVVKDVTGVEPAPAAPKPVRILPPPEQGSAAPAALLLVLAVLWRGRPKRALAALAALAFLLWAPAALATAPPHDVTNLANACDDCHKLHTAPGASLTKLSGNFNLCGSCHTGAGSASAYPFTGTDQATPGTTGKSHRWDATTANARYGAVTPANAEMQKRLEAGKLMCSTCHDQHSQQNAPGDPGSPTTAGQAGRHFMRLNNNTNLLCVNCHSQWNQSNAQVGSYTSGATSSFNSTSTSVTLSSTAGVQPGWQVKRQADPATAYTIVQTVVNGTTVTLVENYKGVTGNGAWDGAKVLSHPVGVALPSASTTYDQPPHDAPDTGTTTAAGTTTTLIDTLTPWIANSLVGQSLLITSGANAGTRTTITANTTTQLTFTAVAQAVASGVTYRIDRDQKAPIRGAATGGTTTTLIDTSQSFTTAGALGMRVRITGPKGNANRFQERTISATTATQITVSTAFGSAIVAGTTYEIDWDGNTTNNVVLDDAGTPSYTQGNTVCLSCHAVHYADSSSATYDNAAGAGDGHLLRRDNNGEVCESCHAQRIHSSATTGSSRAAWGTAFTCRTCHGPHQTSNIFLFNQAVATPNSGTRGVDFRNMTSGAEAYGLANTTSPGSGPCEVCHTDTRNGAEVTGATSTFTASNTAVTLSSTAGLAAGWEVKRQADPATAWTKIQTVVNGTSLTLVAGGYKGTTGSGNWQAANPRFRNTGSGRGAGGSEHYVTKCTTCHAHDGGFSAAGGESGGGMGCESCHNDIWLGMTGGVAKATKHTLGNVPATNASPNDANVTWGNPLSGNAAGVRSCVNMCHGDHTHDLTSPVTATHENNVYVNSASQATRDNATRTSATRMKTDFDAALGTGGLCVSCHQNPVDATHPAVDKTAFANSEHNYTQNTVGASTYTWAYTQHDGGGFARNCTKCHSDAADTNPTDGSIPFGAVHFSSYPSLLSGSTNPSGAPGTFVCYNCHGNGTNGVNRSGKDIATLAARTTAGSSKHPMDADAVHNTLDEYNAAAFGNNLGGKARHANCLDCHEPHAAQASSDSGTVTSATATTLTDSSKSGKWRANEWVGFKVCILTGTGAGQTQTITASNTTGGITVAGWNASAGTPAANATYRIDSIGSDALQKANSGVWGVSVVPSGTASYGIGAATFVNATTTVHSGASGGVVTTAITNGTTVTSQTRNWVGGQWNGYTMRVVTGAQAGQTRAITGNAATTLNLPAATPITLAAGDIFVIYKNADPTKTPVWTNSMVGGYIRNELDQNSRWYRITAFSQPTAGQDYYTLTITPTYCSQTGGACASIISKTKLTTLTTAPASQYQMDHGTSYTISTATYTKTAAPTKELELCFKCHSNWAFGDVPPNVPSGHQDGTAVAETAIPNDFNTTQLAYHPIFSAGKNQPTAVAYSGWNTNAAYTRIDNTGNSSTFGLSNTFTTGWYKESLVKCSDCHSSNTASDPLGPHGSGKKWVVKGLDTSICFTRRNVTASGWETICNSDPIVAGDTANFCLNCHRWDVYGYFGLAGDAPASVLSRVPHDVTGQSQTYGTAPKSGIICQNCHGGDRLGGVHGTNRKRYPYRYDPTATKASVIGGSPANYSGRRMLNGAYWYGVTRATTSTPVACWGKDNPDTVSNCGQAHQGDQGQNAQYSYEDSANIDP